MSERAPEPTGEQPVRAWRCDTCGLISEEEWFAGRHADRREAGLNKWCYGKATGPFYLLSQDQYLDVVLSDLGPRP
jgi:hypothetical protein